MVIPAYNESENIHHVLGALPERVCDLPLHAIVIDDGSADRTTEAARAAGAAAIRLPMNRGQGAALRTGYRLALVTGAEIVVTMDADGQHQPSELSRLVGRSSPARPTWWAARACWARPIPTTPPGSWASSCSPSCCRC